MKTPPRSENPLPALRSLATDPQIISLVIILGLGAGGLYFFGFQLIPFLLAFVIAYFLDAGVQRLKLRGLGHGLAVTLVYTVYLAVYLVLLAGPVQIVARRAVQLAQNLPTNADQLLARFSAFPDFFSLADQVPLDSLPLAVRKSGDHGIFRRTRPFAFHRSSGILPRFHPL